ncbi:MAG: hypothetical protein JO288_10150 [Hyphomicrobiales bacterium]|nr:hypothetical protein [Hyphomicrobiales bacterium]
MVKKPRDSSARRACGRIEEAADAGSMRARIVVLALGSVGRHDIRRADDHGIAFTESMN